ncbi:DNA polymerase III subunit beta [Aquiluna borgnonia]|jgi:DNA polymerase-3 subunit beta|uniref:Beta sliding clamp n=1 Tax=Aquiluna borgnonia TaxID=2499157 RepID=A0A7D4UA70_9MICO|nr:DNA polymerase III subunit beta [Aquiluna borgnonia]QKJ24637.1 DNA polymerase III subunit beta [Aquiluna borgnonia]
MKFQADREVLGDAISFVARLMSPKPQLPQLSGVLITANNNEVVLSVFDYEVSAKVSISAAVDAPGKVLVQGKLLAEIVSKLPGSTVSLNLQESRLQLTSGSSKFTLSSMSLSDYPEIPAMPESSGTVAASEFAQAVSQVAIAASREEVTPVLTAVMITASAKQLTMVATDRFRVAVKDLAWTGKSAEKELLIPARVLQEIAKTFSHNGDLEIAFGQGEKEVVGFSAGNKSVSSATIKGKYPPVLQLFPTEISNFAVLSTHDLLDATKRVALVVDREKPLRYKFGSTEAVLESIGSDVAEASEQVVCSLTGEETIVSLRPQFLSDALSGIESPNVKIGFTVNPNNPNKPGPVLISASDSKSATPDFKYLLQPNLLVS